MLGMCKGVWIGWEERARGREGKEGKGVRGRARQGREGMRMERPVIKDVQRAQLPVVQVLLQLLKVITCLSESVKPACSVSELLCHALPCQVPHLVW